MFRISSSSNPSSSLNYNEKEFHRRRCFSSAFGNPDHPRHKGFLTTCWTLISGSAFLTIVSNAFLADCTYLYSAISLNSHFSTMLCRLEIRSDHSLSRVRLFATPWIAARQASLSTTNSRSSLRLMSIESVMPSNHLILCCLLLLLPPIPPSIRVFSNESTLCMRWPKYWS